MPRQTYNRRNEPKERDKTAKIKRGHALNNNSVTKACDQWLKSRSDPFQPAPAAYTQHSVTVSRGRDRSAHYKPPSMQTLIAADRVAYIERKKTKMHNTTESASNTPEILPFEQPSPAPSLSSKASRRAILGATNSQPPVRNLLFIKKT